MINQMYLLYFVKGDDTTLPINVQLTGLGKPYIQGFGSVKSQQNTLFLNPIVAEHVFPTPRILLLEALVINSSL